MNRTACTYAAVRFLPFRETGEFANVGVVLLAPAAGYFGHRCHTSLGKRLHGFFPELERTVYKRSIVGMETLLNSISVQFDKGGASVDRFHELTRPREGLITFSPTGAIFAESPQQALNDLYERLVLRQFAKSPEYQEQVMRNRLAESLRVWDLQRFYRKLRIGDEKFHVNVPFGCEVEGRVTKVLRPLDLNREEPTDIYLHGDKWVNTLRRLAEFGTLPEHVVIPIQLPTGGERLNAANSVIANLRNVGAQAISIEDQGELRVAARVA